MSKNECKRCSECKHYERVNDNELEDHGDCTLYPVWVDVWAAHYCGQWATALYENKQPIIVMPELDWANIPPEYEYLAQDEDGHVYLFAEEPESSNIDGVWWEQGSDVKHQLLWVGQPNPDWRNTKTKRPGIN